MPDEDDLQPRWPRYGLRGDPFFSNPLDPDEGTLHPIGLFRGRQQERRRLARTVLDADHSATLLYAAGGHGKTTLANAVAYDLAARGYLVLPEEVQYHPDDGMNDIFGRLLRGFLQALSDRGIELPPIPQDPGLLEGSPYPALAQARLLVRTTRIRTGYGFDVQTPVGGGGSSTQYELLQPRFEPGASRRLLMEMMREAAALDERIEGVLVSPPE